MFVILDKRALRAHVGDPAQGAAEGAKPLKPAEQPAAYVLAGRRNGTLYVGVTSGLFGRIAVQR